MEKNKMTGINMGVTGHHVSSGRPVCFLTLPLQACTAVDDIFSIQGSGTFCAASNNQSVSCFCWCFVLMFVCRLPKHTSLGACTVGSGNEQQISRVQVAAPTNKHMDGTTTNQCIFVVDQNCFNSAALCIAIPVPW